MSKMGVTKIDLKMILANKAPKASKRIPGFIVNYLTRLIHQEEINEILEIYKDYIGVEFMEKLVDYFKLTIELRNRENIPLEGRYIFVSNHPLGGLDGICLSAIIGRLYDGNIKYLVNDLLLNIPNLQSIFLPINKHGSQDKRSALLIEEAFASDNQIITFPAGLCSRKIGGMIQDTEWKKSFIQKAVQYERDIVPLYFEGRNSNFFYNSANLRKALGIKLNYEMVLLPDEMFSNSGSSFNIYVGNPIKWQTFDKSKSGKQWAELVRDIVYKLKE